MHVTIIGAARNYEQNVTEKPICSKGANNFGAD